ncbi:MAG: M6 family metalloprotease domain-containing protein [Bacteroidales bacterium]|nr:M6 family metalloprotease domain-containing protein [Bacteroidales bacterium]
MIKTILTTGLMCAVLAASALPAWPGLHKVTLADGTQVTCRQVGDEYAHWFVTTDGRALDRNAAGEWQWLTDTDVMSRQQQMLDARAATFSARAKRARQATQGDDIGRITNFPTEGEVRGLFILVEFEDVKFEASHDSLRYTRQLNEEGFSDDEATGSARDYFISQSYGVFTPRFDVIGPVVLPHNESFYGANDRLGQDKDPGQMVIDACQLAHDSLGVDFSRYDFDDDGTVDFVFILYAGYGENYGASARTIWPHMSHLTYQGKRLELDGKSFDLYACSCELRGNSGNEIDGIGALCHEFGHVLGLPDLYDTSGSTRVQLGEWDVMDAGSYNNNSRTPPSYSALERYSLGWIDLTDLDEPADSIVVTEINEGRSAYRIRTRTAGNGEYFILENHQQQGWDAYHPARGLMITHIDYEASAWRTNTVNSGMHPRVDLEEADGSQGSRTATDLYPTETNDRFTDYSKPNSLAWDKTPTERGVDRIRQESDGNISLRFMRDRLERPMVLDPIELTDTSFTAVWEPVEEAIAYRIDLLEELPDSLNPLLLTEDFARCESGNYPVAGSSDIATELDNYMQTSGWSGACLYEAGGYVRIGAYGQDGTLQTPLLATRPSQDPEGHLTLQYTASAYPGKTVNYTITMLDADLNALADTTLKANRNLLTHTLHFDDRTEAFAFRFETDKERLYLDDLRIAMGTHDSLTMLNLGPAAWSIDSIAPTLDDAEASSLELRHTVIGLAPQRTYHYWITALDTEPMRSSLPSPEKIVTTLAADESGIEKVCADELQRGNMPDGLYDLMGRRITQPSQGFYITEGRIQVVR